VGKSARTLGREVGKTAQEVNSLLKEHGYLYGEPGAYGLTEKGGQYAQEQDHHRGTGGYAHYNRDWTTRTWNDETAASLAADIEAARSQPSHEVMGEQDDGDILADYGDDLSLEADRDDTKAKLLYIGAVFGAVYVAPRLRPFWERRVRPAARRLRDKLSRPESESTLSSGLPEREAAVEPSQMRDGIEPEDAASDEATSGHHGQDGLGPKS
jgi:hypothetical protein